MKKLYYGFCFIFIAVLLASCFSPWEREEDQGNNLTISWGDSSDTSGRFVNSLASKDIIQITLTGPGEPVTQVFKGNVSSAAFNVASGTWVVTAKVFYLDIPKGKGVLSVVEVLKLMGIEEVRIAGGKSTNVQLNLYTASEVSTWAELKAAIEESKNNDSENFKPDIEGYGLRTELFLITENLLVEGDNDGGSIVIIRPIILVAEKKVTIASPSDEVKPFSIDGGSLTVGLPGMTGEIRIVVRGGIKKP